MRNMKGMEKSRKLQRRAPETGGCGSLIKDIVTGLTGAVLEYAVLESSPWIFNQSSYYRQGVYNEKEIEDDF